MRQNGGINPKNLPYIDWERTVNPGQGAEGGEKREVQRVTLFDSKGSPFVWLDENYVSYNLKKGWKIVGHGNFDKVRRHDGTQHQQLEDIRAMVEERAQSTHEADLLRAENEQLKAERAQLIAERSAMSASAAAGDFRTEDEKDAGVVSVVLDHDVPAGETALESTSATTFGDPKKSTKAK
ncbi:hypothetical protein EP7_004331 [Isosphaeraceae bacterium EP7]